MNQDETPPIAELPLLLADDEPREVTAAYGVRHRLPPVADCDRAMLLAIAAQGASGRSYDLRVSSAHVAAICADYVALAHELSASAPKVQAGLHACAIDYLTHPSPASSAALENAGVRATIARLRGTGEIIPREAMLLLEQLADDRCRCGSDDPACKCFVPAQMETF